MPVDKPTISHQLKTVRNTGLNKSKTSAVIHGTSFAHDFSHARSHLKVSKASGTKNCYHYNNNNNNEKDKDEKISESNLEQCTKLLRNVLASDALVNKHINHPKKNKSTSTDLDFQPDSNQPKSTVWKLCHPDKTAKDLLHRSSVDCDDQTEAESLTSEPARKSSPPSQQLGHTQIGERLPCLDTQHPGLPIPVSGGGCSLDDPMHNGATGGLCFRCHDPIGGAQQTGHCNQQQHRRQTTEVQKSQSGVHGDDNKIDQPSRSGPRLDLRSLLRSDSLMPESIVIGGKIFNSGSPGGDKIETIATYILTRLHDLQAVAKATRDADLDCIITDMDQAFQLMLRENGAVIQHMRAVVEKLKWENSTFKQESKSLKESIHDVKLENKQLKQDQKRRVEELKLELQLKSEELALLSERDKASVSHWRDKSQRMEKETDRLRLECQGLTVQTSQRDSEIQTLRRAHSKAEAALKEQLVQSSEQADKDVQSLRQRCSRYEAELQHNQSVIRAAREQVVSLLDRHKVGSTASMMLASPGCQQQQQQQQQHTGSDWVDQAASLHRVLSMGSLARDGSWSGHTTQMQSHVREPANHSTEHSSGVVVSTKFPKASQYECNNPTFSHSMSFSSVPLLGDHNNNHYDSSSSKLFERTSIRPQTTAVAVESHSRAESPPLTLSPQSSCASLTVAALHSAASRDDGWGSSTPTPARPSSSQAWLPPATTATAPSNIMDPHHHRKMSSASSMRSTVSSLRSSDDAEFRSDLQKLDTHIVRLQNTLKSKFPTSPSFKRP